MIILIPTGRAPEGVAVPSWPIEWPADCTVSLHVSDEIPVRVREWIRTGTFVAHNAESFDAEAWKRFGEGDPEWCDTIHLCRAAGYPAGLDRACKAFGIPGKDVAGGKALELLYKAKAGRFGISYPLGTTALWDAMLRYNMVDVLALRALYGHIGGFGEPDVLAVNARINERGCPVDVAFAERLRALWIQCAAGARANVEELTDGEIEGTDIRSVPKVKAWLKRQGLDIPSLERKAIEQMMQDPDSFFGDTDDETVNKVRRVIMERQQATRATVGKVERVFSVVDTDSRVRGMFVVYGAHTGRFTGRDLQPHNFPRGIAKLDVESLMGCGNELKLEDVGHAAREAGCSIGDALATLMRPVIRAGEGKLLAPCDYGAVEARGTAWIARCGRVLDTFRDPKKCVYRDMATVVFGVPYGEVTTDMRQVGKVIVLGCGYGMGWRKFETTAKLAGADLDAIGVNPEACVKAYRNAYPEIPRVWYALDDAARAAIEGGKTTIAGRCVFQMRGRVLTVRLPSGRHLRYRNARIEMLAPRWDPNGAKRPTMVYDSPQGFPKILYGGLLCENIVQGLCRDLLVDAMVQIDPVHPIVLHVHDEIVPEIDEHHADESLSWIARTMSTAPAWAPGFPIRVEGWTNRHYTKKPFSTSAKVDAMEGVLL